MPWNVFCASLNCCCSLPPDKFDSYAWSLDIDVRDLRTLVYCLVLTVNSWPAFSVKLFETWPTHWSWLLLCPFVSLCSTSEMHAPMQIHTQMQIQTRCKYIHKWKYRKDANTQTNANTDKNTDTNTNTPLPSMMFHKSSGLIETWWIIIGDNGDDQMYFLRTIFFTWWWWSDGQIDDQIDDDDGQNVLEWRLKMDGGPWLESKTGTLEMFFPSGQNYDDFHDDHKWWCDDDWEKIQLTKLVN